MPAALDGVRVLDLSRVLAGPWATQIFGDLGADVVKIEKPGVGDDTRAWGPPFTPAGDAAAPDARRDAAYYLVANRNKRSVTIDFTTPEGADIVRRLAARAHIVVENFKVGALARYGLDYASLAALNPALVYCSVTGFGQTGPYAPRAGYDYLVQAMGGLMSVTGQPDGAPGAEPMKVGVAVADLFTGMYAVAGVLAALRHAERTGQGQHIDVALLDAQVAMLANQAQNYFATGVAPTRMGNAHPNITPYQVFETADGHIVLAVGNDGQFASFCRVAGLESLAADPRFATSGARVAARGELVAHVAAAMRTRTSAAWIATLEEAGVPCGPINTIDAVFADPHVQARGLAQTMRRDDGQDVTVVASPLRLSATPPRTDIAPPTLGASTAAVLAELGYSDADISGLRARGVV
ncbi:MAG: CoA transferase [Alphaproteobacteria bacterium]|nr:CoA transferase [Alphaproteobacteria bacterium]